MKDFIARCLALHSKLGYLATGMSDKAIASGAILYREIIADDFIGDDHDVKNVLLMLDNTALWNDHYHMAEVNRALAKPLH